MDRYDEQHDELYEELYGMHQNESIQQCPEILVARYFKDYIQLIETDIVSELKKHYIDMGILDPMISIQPSFQTVHDVLIQRDTLKQDLCDAVDRVARNIATNPSIHLMLVDLFIRHADNITRLLESSEWLIPRIAMYCMTL
jgi:hypothetical protein